MIEPPVKAASCREQPLGGRIAALDRPISRAASPDAVGQAQRPVLLLPGAAARSKRAEAMVSFGICGIEHSGTTLISDLFRQVPGIDAGFEVGVLLCDGPRAFRNLSPFSDHMLEGWGLTLEAFHECCEQDGFAGFYDMLQRRATVLKPDTQHIFDKTPRYFLELADVTRKVKMPFIVSYKDPVAIVYSDFRRANIDNFWGWYRSYLEPKLEYMRQLYANHIRSLREASGRVVFVSLEDLCLNTRLTCERLFAHVAVPFDLDYLLMKRLRYDNTRFGTIDVRAALEYRDRLPRQVRMSIRTDFSEFERWFYD